MKSNKYIVVEVCENGKYYAHAWKADGSAPRAASKYYSYAFDAYGLEPGAISKERACQIVEMLRAMYKDDGVYMFDGPESPRF